MTLDQLQYADRFEGISGSAIREIFKMIAKPNMISFAGGNPSPSALPDLLVKRFAEEVLASNGKQILQYGATEGYPPFLESLKCYAEAKIGCPIKGDLKYGAKRSNPDGSISLLSRTMQFIHPVSKKEIVVEAPLPDDNLWKSFILSHTP